MAESEEELKKPLDEGKRRVKSQQKTKILASGPITWWQKERENVEVVTDFIFLGSKITADGDWNPDVSWFCLL